MTLETLRRAVASKLGLDNSAGNERDLIDEWLNQGVLEILLRTHCTVEAGSMNTIADTWQYQLDTDILAIRDIWREDSSAAVEPMVRVSEAEILNYHRGTGAADASRTRYAVTGSNLLLLWPTPSSVFALKLLYVPRPTAMSAVGHDPSTLTYGRIPTEFHKAIEYYALWQGAEYDDSRPSEYGRQHEQNFEKALHRIRASMQRKGGVDMPRARTRSWRGRRSLVRENDRY
jgi:hypothetical protein